VSVEKRVICTKMSGDGDHARRRGECLQTGTSMPLKLVTRNLGLQSSLDRQLTKLTKQRSDVLTAHQMDGWSNGSAIRALVSGLRTFAVCARPAADR